VDIPIGARIIAVADTYDAIVTDRPYRKGRSHEQALLVLQEERGKQFDPRVVDVFVKLYGVPADTDEHEEMSRAA
jgi:HD-GYP domain-containing protein (c-di-GMP phosphodiesterase class II)